MSPRSYTNVNNPSNQGRLYTKFHKFNVHVMSPFILRLAVTHNIFVRI